MAQIAGSGTREGAFPGIANREPTAAAVLEFTVFLGRYTLYILPPSQAGVAQQAEQRIRNA